MDGLQLIATGGALPGRLVTNDALSRAPGLDTSDEWISSRTGIRQRYFCAPGESCATLAETAARQALSRSGLSPKDVGCCLCATLSGPWATPSVACLLQRALGLREDIPVMDINAACSGFVYAAATARALLAAQGGRYALVVGCEQLSRLLDMADRTTCVLFGDGAGAAVLELSPNAPFAASLGARGGLEICAEGAGPGPAAIRMDGRAVFRFAVEALPKALDSVLRQAGKRLPDVDWVVCHQANSRIIDHCVKKLSAPPEKFYKNMERFGNTSAASIPMALNELAETGRLHPGQLAACIGFGGGLTWGGMLLPIKEVFL